MKTLFFGVLAAATVLAGSTMADVRHDDHHPVVARHHAHQVCTTHHHHRVCHMVR